MFLFDTAKEFFDMIHSPFIEEGNEFEIIRNESETDEEKGYHDLIENENQLYDLIMSFIISIN